MKQYDLVFEGGGAKGSVFVGALNVFLKEKKCTFRRLLGTSAGAITATLLAAGYTPDQMLEAVNERLPNGKPRFSSFLDVPKDFEEKDIQNSLIFAVFDKVDLPLIPESGENYMDKLIFKQLNKVDPFREIFSFIERGGLFSGETFVEWLEEKLDQAKPGFGILTLKQLYEATHTDLSLVITDTKSKVKRVLNHRTAPDCPVKYAVRMSMSIPFVWQEVRWNSAWGLYLGEDISGNTIVDGGVLSNFPIDLMINGDTIDPRIMGDTDPNGADTLGFLIDETLDVAGSDPLDEDNDDSEDNLQQQRHKVIRRIKRLVDTMTGARDHAAMYQYSELICRLPAKGYGTTEFDMSDNRLNALLKAGENAMKNYFSQ